jgi:hypothetical protein
LITQWGSEGQAKGLFSELEGIDVHSVGNIRALINLKYSNIVYLYFLQLEFRVGGSIIIIIIYNTVHKEYYVHEDIFWDVLIEYIEHR